MNNLAGLHSMNGLVLIVAVALTGACASTAPPRPTSVAAAIDASPSPSAAGSPALIQAAPSTSPSVSAVGSPSAAPQAAPRPLSGEYAVTANLGDHTLSVVSIGVASVVATVQLNSAPRVVAMVPNSDTAVVAEDTPDSHVVEIVSLNSRAEIARIDVGTRPDQIVAPPIGHVGPLLVVSDEGNSIRSIDPLTKVVGAPLALGVGPHTVAFGGDQDQDQRVFVANAGDGSISIVDPNATMIESNVKVGGKPTGVAWALAGQLWVADGDAGTLTALEPDTARVEQTLTVGPHLTLLAITPDGRYLVASSTDPGASPYNVDLLAGAAPQDRQQLARVTQLTRVSGVVALATGAEITRAYITTSQGNVIYWDLESNDIAQTVPVGHNPVGLALGFVMP